MKYFLKILTALVLAAAVVTAVYYYTNDKQLPFETKKSFSTTVTKPPASEKYAARKLIASLDKYGFKLYKSGKSVILEHKGKEYTYSDWSSTIDEEPPKMYYSDFDGDDEKELVIRAVAGSDDSTGEYVYELYILNPVKVNGKDDYSVLLVSQDTWHKVLDDQVTEELSQLKSCSKILQFAMDEKGSAISYDSTTGMVKKAAYVGYAKALQDNDGKYMTLFGWNKSKGLFYVEDSKIKVEVDCIATYDESHLVQNIGKIYFTLTINENNQLSVVPRSMYFKADDKYKVSDPRKTAKNKWSFTRNNSFEPQNPGTVNWAKYHIDMDSSVITDTADLSAEETDIKYVKSIGITQGGVALTAAGNYTFSKDPVDKGDFSITINKGKKDEYEISYLAYISKDRKSVFISFDKNYPQKEIKTIDISYGSK